MRWRITTVQTTVTAALLLAGRGSDCHPWTLCRYRIGDEAGAPGVYSCAGERIRIGAERAQDVEGALRGGGDSAYARKYQLIRGVLASIQRSAAEGKWH